MESFWLYLFRKLLPLLVMMLEVFIVIHIKWHEKELDDYDDEVKM